MAIRIITDSASDLNLTVAKKRRVDVVPMSIQFGKASFFDGRDLSSEVFYKLLQEGKESPTTSQPTPDAFLKLFEQAKAAGDHVVAILLSSELSGTLQSAMIAKGMCEYEPIYIVDSLNATLGIQMLVNYACKLRDSGLPAADIAGQVERLKSRVRVMAVIDTLEYLRRGGRLSGLQASIGTVTKLKPVVAVRDGKVSVAGKGFGTAAAVKQLIKMIAEDAPDDAFPAYFLYTDDQNMDQNLLPKLEEQGLLPQRLHYAPVGPTIGTHIGPKGFGLAYIAKER